ncbi:hypothetical protein VNO77_34086 [Canavalia gladiata]|uniref:Uncharacterized protein n=1 Tax=Canavalia gladiata TaxID=3824 RepID=A0AAN9KD21_CANGL
MAGTASLLRCRVVDMVGIQPLSSWVEQARKELDADHRVFCIVFVAEYNYLLFPCIRNPDASRMAYFSLAKKGRKRRVISGELHQLWPRPRELSLEAYMIRKRWVGKAHKQSWDPLMAPLNGKEDHAYIDITKSNASVNWSGLNDGRLGLQIRLLQLESRL